MQMIRVEEAVGSVLCHDITKIVPGQEKGPAFQKGHVVKQEDIPELLKLGKEHLYVWELKEGFVHENEAGMRLAQALRGTGLTLTEPSEGKVKLIADMDGLCLINGESLFQINMMEEIVVATINNQRPVKKGTVVAGARVVPLIIEEEKLQAFLTTVDHINKRLDAFFALDAKNLSRPELIAEINKISHI